MPEELRLDITGMTCSACVTSVEKIISNQPNVSYVSVNLPLNRALIEVENNDKNKIQSLIEA
ncbi:MAG: heavy metal-associated domain-containing protein, partial [Candidatus Thermoplasmatota archaeon]|nr:heavy metal-associated domain-containing protein [Candidatus Thermoplasmatota archaeon]